MDLTGFLNGYFNMSEEQRDAQFERVQDFLIPGIGAPDVLIMKGWKIADHKTACHRMAISHIISDPGTESCAFYVSQSQTGNYRNLIIHWWRDREETDVPIEEIGIFVIHAPGSSPNRRLSASVERLLKDEGSANALRKFAKNKKAVKELCRKLNLNSAFHVV